MPLGEKSAPKTRSGVGSGSDGDWTLVRSSSRSVSSSWATGRGDRRSVPIRWTDTVGLLPGIVQDVDAEDVVDLGADGLCREIAEENGLRPFARRVHRQRDTGRTDGLLDEAPPPLAT